MRVPSSLIAPRQLPFADLLNLSEASHFPCIGALTFFSWAAITKSKRVRRRFFQSVWYKSDRLGIILNVGIGDAESQSHVGYSCAQEGAQKEVLGYDDSQAAR